MASLVSLVQVEVLIGTILGFVILYFQMRAYRRHKRKFFATLASSTVLAIGSTVFAAAPYFVPMAESQSITLYRLSVPIAILATVLATWGSVQFFLAFDEK